MPNSCNYQVSGFSDSLSFISEPPDIRNWFSSYAYESPQLNTYENCGYNCLRVADSKEERVDDNERGNKQEKGEEKKLEGTTKVDNKRVCDEVDSSTKYTNTPKDCDQTKLIKVSDFADSLSLPSEPPDIRNWFSSYAYESPEIDTYKNCEDNGLRVGNSEEERVDDGERGNKQEEGEKEKLEGTTKNKNKLVSDEVYSNTSTSTKYTNAPKDSNQTESIKVLGGLPDSPALSPEPPHVGKWFSSYVYESPLLNACTDFSGCESQCIELDGAENYAGKCYEEKKKRKLGDLRNDAERITLPISEDNSLHGLSTNSNLVDDTNSQLQCSDKAIKIVAVNRPNLTDLRKGILHEDILKLDTTEDHTVASAQVRKRDLRSEDFICKEPLNNVITDRSKESTDRMAQTRRLLKDNNVTGGSVDKENKKNSFQENGFISTRKKIKETSSKRYVHDPLIVNSGNVPKRLPFSEKTNFEHNDGLEITGKWKCPRKNNSQLGPPLKQLRLEKWVNRI